MGIKGTVKNLVGQKFSYLTVVQRAGSNKNGRAMWLCVCSCGIEKIVLGKLLLSGKVKSCGHARSELLRAYPRYHGERAARTKEYATWCRIKSRCVNKRDPEYEDYGGRGIIMCKRWNESYTAFLEDMGRAPNVSYSIDRIDNSKGYEPNNCRWTTAKVQANNRRVRLAKNYKKYGVSYFCSIYRNGKRIYLGHVPTEIEARKIIVQWMESNGESDAVARYMSQFD